MSDRSCPVRTRGDDVCGKAVPPGRTICGACSAVARLDLDDVIEVLQQLDVTLARQAVVASTVGGTSGCPQGCTHGPADDHRCRASARLPFDLRASDAASALQSCLYGWARVYREQAVIRMWDQSSIRAQVVVLRVATLKGGADWLPDAVAELRAAVRDAWAACDRPPEQRVVGRCSTEGCGRPVYAREAARRARCITCGVSYDVQDLRERSLAAADHAEVPASELAKILGVPVGTIHSWRSRGRLVPTRINAAGQPVYRVSDAHAAKRSETAS